MNNKNKSESMSLDEEQNKSVERGLSALLKKFEKEIKFVLTGGFNTVLDFTLFFVLKSLLGLDPVLSNICSSSVCICVSFYLNYKFVWKSKKSKRETAPGFLLVSFFSAWVVQSIAIKFALWIFNGESTLQAMLAKLCASVPAVISNYFGYKLVFSTDLKKIFSCFKNQKDKKE